MGSSQLGDAFALPGPQQEHGMRVSATLLFRASSTCASAAPPFHPLLPLIVPPELLVQALEMQARLLELRGYMRVTMEVLAWLLVLRCLEWMHVCLVPGWVWAVDKERC